MLEETPTKSVVVPMSKLVEATEPIRVTSRLERLLNVLFDVKLTVVGLMVIKLDNSVKLLVDEMFKDDPGVTPVISNEMVGGVLKLDVAELLSVLVKNVATMSLVSLLDVDLTKEDGSGVK